MADALADGVLPMTEDGSAPTQQQQQQQPSQQALQQEA
jgi:hypothetical protein